RQCEELAADPDGKQFARQFWRQNDLRLFGDPGHARNQRYQRGADLADQAAGIDDADDVLVADHEIARDADHVLRHLVDIGVIDALDADGAIDQDADLARVWRGDDQHDRAVAAGPAEQGCGRQHEQRTAAPVNQAGDPVRRSRHRADRTGDEDLDDVRGRHRVALPADV